MTRDHMPRAPDARRGERSHLFDLAQGTPPPLKTRAQTSLSPALRRVIESHPYPAVISTPRWDVVAWNAAAQKLFGDLTGQDSLRTMFANPNRRARRPNWETDARRLLAQFRFEAGRAANPSEFEALISELSDASEDFRRLWKDHEVTDVLEGAKVVSHPEVGVIEIEHVTLMHSEPDGRALRVRIYTPKAGESTARAAKLFENL